MTATTIFNALVFAVNCGAVGFMCLITSRWMGQLRREHEGIREAVKEHLLIAFIARRDYLDARLRYLHITVAACLSAGRRDDADKVQAEIDGVKKLRESVDKTIEELEEANKQ